MGELPLDRIHVCDLKVRCIVGVKPDERANKQDVIIHLTLWADLRRAGQSDRIEDTVDYSSLEARVVEMVEASSYFLLERLAERIAEICLADERVARARVRVDKPGALRFARTVGVEIAREHAGRTGG